ncbi:MAG TPA: tyrosine-type recombinase/integrase, partial [Polyangiaceae bacterium]
RKATIITPAEAKRILMAMPERSRRTGTWVRPLFIVLWETGLRPVTVLRLLAPLHYSKGQKHLFITREIDKEGFERNVPLSPAARKALDRVCPKAGRLFDNRKGALKVYLRIALEKAGLSDRKISVYDFKHTRISIGANTPGVALAGVAHLVGHKYVSTTALYVQSGETAAAAALRAMASPRFGGRSGGRSSRKRRAKGGT